MRNLRSDEMGRIIRMTTTYEKTHLRGKPVHTYIVTSSNNDGSVNYTCVECGETIRGGVE